MMTYCRDSFLKPGKFCNCLQNKSNNNKNNCRATPCLSLSLIFSFLEFGKGSCNFCRHNIKLNAIFYHSCLRKGEVLRKGGKKVKAFIQNQ